MYFDTNTVSQSYLNLNHSDPTVRESANKCLLEFPVSLEFLSYLFF